MSYKLISFIKHFLFNVTYSTTNISKGYPLDFKDFFSFPSLNKGNKDKGEKHRMKISQIFFNILLWKWMTIWVLTLYIHQGADISTSYWVGHFAGHWVCEVRVVYGHLQAVTIGLWNRNPTFGPSVCNMNMKMYLLDSLIHSLWCFTLYSNNYY